MAFRLSLNQDVKDVAGVTSASNPVNFLVLIANSLILLIAAISVFYVIKGAIEFMTGGEKNNATKTITNAIIGIIVAVLAFFIVQVTVGGASFLNSKI